MNEMTQDIDTLGKRIARAREAAQLSTAQLARRIGIRTATLTQWETDASEPRSDRLRALAGHLNVSLIWLLVGRGTAPSDNGPVAQEVRLLKAEIGALGEAAAQIAERLEHLGQRLEDLSVAQDGE
jgi:transcriptional regulator with XRE-family HTH domain